MKVSPTTHLRFFETKSEYMEGDMQLYDHIVPEVPKYFSADGAPEVYAY